VNVPRLVLIVCLVLLWAATAATAQAQTQSCSYKLGFKMIADQMPQELGGCLEDEHYNALNGGSLQRTANGLLVWRKLDNFTAFTDGYHTWVNGPFGIQERLNTERFDWEAVAPPAVAAPVPPPPPQYVAPTVAFSIDSTTIARGQCVTIRWNVSNIKALYLRGPDVDTGVTGQGDRLVCPGSTSTYRLDIIDLNNNTVSPTVTINVQ